MGQVETIGSPHGLPGQVLSPLLLIPLLNYNPDISQIIILWSIMT